MELKAKGYIAAAEVRAGHDEAALASLRDFENPRQQAYILHIAALAQARAGRKDACKANFIRAVNLVTGDPKPGPGGTSMKNIAVAEALAGDFSAAVQHAKEAGDFGMTLFRVAELQAESGDFAGARKTAEYPTKIRRGSHGCDGLLAEDRLPSGQGRAGGGCPRLDCAEETGGIRASLLVGLAEGLIGDKNP